MIIEIGLEIDYTNNYVGHLLRTRDHDWNSQAGAAELEASVLKKGICFAP